MSRCLFVATDQPRVVEDRHLRDCEASGCVGCLPCVPEHGHCTSCGITHLDNAYPLTCARCVGHVRDDLAEILVLCGRLPDEAETRGIESEALMLAGPVADPATWARRNRLVANAAAAAPDEADPKRPRHPANKAMLAWLDDCRDELHPLWVLGTWEQVWRDSLGHETDRPVTVALAVDYLDQHLTRMAQAVEPDFAQFAAEVRACCGRVEDVLHDSRRPETGAPCPMCGQRALVKDYGSTIEADRWKCPGCGAAYTEHDYRSKVAAVYVLHAKALTASQMRETYRVPEGTLRQWVKRGKVHQRGRDESGRMLYDVEDTLRMRGEVDAGQESA